MKTLTSLLIGFVSLFIISCSGSETYRGSWKAMDSSGAKLMIVFSTKSFEVKDSSGKSKNYTYSQHSVLVNNSAKTYGIKLGDGRNYQIHFPLANNDSVGLIRDDSGQPVYTISRKGFVSYNDIYSLQ